ncbi:MAG: TraB/GumN family protein [Acidobacteriia bacterium]|nr:TraB/GumN family protein [Terriglobia bacterium]
MKKLFSFRKRKIFFVKILIGLSLFTLFDKGFQSEIQSSVEGGSKGCLWEVSSKGTVFLLGSIHLLKPNSYQMTTAAKIALNRAKVVVFEVDMESMNSPKSQQLILSKGSFSGPEVNLNISLETFYLAKKKIEGMGLSFDAFRSFKPWLLMLTMTTAKLKELGFDPNHGVDQFFFDKAKYLNKEILNLETIEYQLDRLDGMSTEDQELALIQTLEDLDLIEQEFNAILKAWNQGNLAELERLLLSSFKNFPDVYKRLITDRNRNWLSRIKQFLEEDRTTLIIVGTAHLVGPDGLVQLLMKQGHKVKQL